MISIKVCKLSDLINKVIAIIVSIIFIVLVFKIVLKSIERYSNDFVRLAIEQTLCVKEKEDLVLKMIFANIPIRTLKIEDDIEKEIDLVDNKGMVINEIGMPKLELKSPVLLQCQKLSDNKYKIGDVTVNNYTKKDLDVDELEKSLFTKIERDCRVLIYHTHTSESYIGAENYRSEDNEANVVKVGETLKDELNRYGIFVRHDKTLHDYPSYNGAYKSSLKTVENILKNENYDIIIDVHRDALSSNSQYRPTAEINGETVAKLMFVVGTNTAGLKHDNWIQNMKFAVAVQQRANELFPGLFRDMHLSTSRYNQHTSNKAVILEVGATGNTVEEACLAMKYFAAVLNAIRQ